MSIPTSTPYRNKGSVKENQNKLRSRQDSARHKGAQLQKMSGLPYKRNLDATMHNIENISHRIGELLQVVKQPKSSFENYIQPNSVQNRGFEEYRRRILNLGKIQQNCEIIEASIKAELIKKAQPVLRNNYYLPQTSVAREQLDDITPISRPSKPLTPPKVNIPLRSRSPIIISRPSSKYINTRPQPKPHQTYSPASNQNNLQKSHTNKHFPEEPKSKQQEKSLIIQKQHGKAERYQLPKVAEEIQNSNKIQEMSRKSEKQSESERQNQSSKSSQLRMKKNFTFHQNESSSQTPVDDLIAQGKQELVPSRPSFEIKVYPCDLNKDSIKPFIANRLATVVKVDIQFHQMKKSFVAQQFQSNLPITKKKSILLDVLWSRGLMIDQRDLDYVIDLNVAIDQISQDYKYFKTFSSFVEVFVDKYLQAEFKWEKRVLQMLTLNEIETTLFKPKFLDLQHRGYLRVQDLSCFINLYADGSPCFKNRQVQELYFRFCRHEPDHQRLSYQGFLNAIVARN